MGYIGINDVARPITSLYVGVNGIARKVVTGYIGVNDVARVWWDGSNSGLNSPYPILKSSSNWYAPNIELDSKGDINVLRIVDAYDPAEAENEVVDSWFADIGNAGDITCYLEYVEDKDDYILYIAGNGSGMITANPDSSGAFMGFIGLYSATGFDLLDTSNVTDMTSMFALFGNQNTHMTEEELEEYGVRLLQELDLRGFDVSNVIDMTQMFQGCGALKLDVSTFNPQKVKSLQQTFTCMARTIILDNFNARSATNCYHMFDGCDASELNLEGFDTSNVTTMNGMFANCQYLVNLDVSGFNTSKVTSMAWMFDGCTNLTHLPLTNFDTSNVTTMYHMFDSCKALTTLNLTSFNTSKVTSMAGMFYYAQNLSNIYVSSGWNTENAVVTNMFYNCGTTEVSYI